MASGNIGESRDSFSDAQIQQALKLCKDTTRDHVLQMITTGIDIGLKNLEAKRADATTDELVELNRGIREIKEKESHVRDRYSRNFESWFDTGECPLAQNTGESGLGSGNLSLVDTESLEQQIIVERMTSGVAAETQSQYAHLNRRFCLLKDARIKPADSPIGPSVQGRLLIDALEEIEVPSNIRIVGLRVMERNFSEALGYLYSSLNGKLIALEILPEIKHHIWRTADSLRGGRGQSSAGMTESQRKVMEDRRREASADDIGSILKELLGSRLGDDHQSEDGSVGKDFLQDSELLLDMLDSMEDGAGTESLLERLDTKAAELSETKPFGATREVLELVDKLGSQFQKSFMKNAGSRQALLAKRMTTPLGKLAVIDPGLLMEAEHPVREVLKQMRIFADVLEIKDAQVGNAFFGRFEKLASEFETIAAMTIEQQKEYAGHVEVVVNEIKDCMQQNIGRVNQYHKELEQHAKRRSALAELVRKQAELKSLSVGASHYLFTDGLDALQHLAVGQDLQSPEEPLTSSISDLLNLLSGDKSLAALVSERLKSLALIDAMYRLQLLLDGSDNKGKSALEIPGSTAMEIEDPEDQTSDQKLWFGRRIKPGAWLKLPDDESNPSYYCRLYRIYEEGRRCVFVDGMGFKAAEYTAKEVQARLEDGRIKLVS